MYRQPAERPREPPLEAKPTARFEIKRSRALLALLLVMFSLVGVIVHTLAGGRTAGFAVLCVYGPLVLYVLLVVMRSFTTEIDYAARRVRVGREDFTFDELAFARVFFKDTEASLALRSRDGRDFFIARGVHEHTKTAAAEINLALAAGYAALGDMPPELANAVRFIDQRFPLASFSKLPEDAQRKRIEEIFQQLPVANLQVNHATKNTVLATANVRGTRVSLLYSLTKDRVEVSIARKSNVGRSIELLRDKRSMRGTGQLLVAPDVFVNGHTNRDAFSKLNATVRDRAIDAMSRLGLRVLRIHATETRAIKHGLRELRDPGGRLGAMLDLVLEIGEGIST